MISTMGRVYSRSRGMLSGTKDYLPNGNPRRITYMIKVGDGWKKLSGHRMVLETFRGPAPPGTEGCHDDGQPFRNVLSNLRWDTHKANTADSIRHGTFAYTDGFKSRPMPPKRGAENHNAKIDEGTALEIMRCLRLGEKQETIARKVGTTVHTVGSIARGKSWAWLTRAAA